MHDVCKVDPLVSAPVSILRGIRRRAGHLTNSIYALRVIRPNQHRWLAVASARRLRPQESSCAQLSARYGLSVAHTRWLDQVYLAARGSCRLVPLLQIAEQTLNLLVAVGPRHVCELRTVYMFYVRQLAH